MTLNIWPWKNSEPLGWIWVGIVVMLELGLLVVVAAVVRKGFR